MGTLPDAVVILRDQTEGHLLHLVNYIVAWVNFPTSEMTNSRVQLKKGSADDIKLR